MKLVLVIELAISLELKPMNFVMKVHWFIRHSNNSLGLEIFFISILIYNRTCFEAIYCVALFFNSLSLSL